MMDSIQIACAQMTWDAERASEEHILAQTAQAGYAGSFEAHPNGSRSGRETVELYARYGIKPVPGYLSGRHWVKSQQEDILARAAILARHACEMGGAEIYVGPDRVPERDSVAARVGPRDALSAVELQQLADTLNRVGEVTLSQGVRACFHSHTGSYIETREEIDRLFSLLDRSLVFMGPDIGHLTWAGADPIQFCSDYADSIKTMHIKDIDPRVREEGIRNAWDYQTFSDRGIFAEIGEGMVDFAAVFGVLREKDYRGWVVVEIDVTTKPSALESVTTSRRNLRRWGL
jgi:inosose dehydratase